MRQRNPGAKRLAVMSAAAAAFENAGFEATSTATIAREAGVSEGILFHHFGSKHGLLEACATAEAEAFASAELPRHRSRLDYERLVDATFGWIGENRMIRRMWAEGDDRIIGALRRGWQGGIVPGVAEALVVEMGDQRFAHDCELHARQSGGVAGATPATPAMTTTTPAMRTRTVRYTSPNTPIMFDFSGIDGYIDSSNWETMAVGMIVSY